MSVKCLFFIVGKIDHEKNPVVRLKWQYRTILRARVVFMNGEKDNYRSGICARQSVAQFSLLIHTWDIWQAVAYIELDVKANQLTTTIL